MNPELQRIRRLFLELYEQQHSYLSDKPDHVLSDLQHECEALRFAEEFSLRAAAQINLAAVVMIQKARKTETVR